MSYANLAANVENVDEGALFGLHKLLARTRDVPAGEKKPVVGSWMQLPGANLARMIASMGFDFVLVDAEHGDIDDGEMHRLVAAIGNQGCSPIVRIPAPENFIVKRALDTGEARKFVSYCRFPSARATRPTGDSIAASPYSALNGVRGAGSPFAPALFKQSMGDYLANANKQIFLAVQIETEEGLENCEEIAKVDGIDMLFVGPNDLCSSMGLPPLNHPNEPLVQAAIARVLKAAHDAGKYAGIFCVTPEQVLQRAEQGFDFMNLGADTVAVGAWNGEALNAIEKIR
ncbi:hypothetical protein JCM24511_09333 [Saitozyma sp. JCM 24511]|nr:hypothetical protein JCM24511_09333 [Saitozyma sp. JCM 24511]